MIVSLPFFRALLISLWFGIFPAGGNLAGIDYSDGTPAVVIQQRDQQGRVRRLADAAGERTLNFDVWGGLADENYSTGGALAGWSVTRSRDAIGRLSWLTAGLTASGTSVHSIGYGYNSSSRVETVTSGGKTASYRYDPLHQRVAQIGIASGTTPVLYGTLQYDALRRLERISYHNGQTGGAFHLFSDHLYQRDGYGNIGGVTTKDRTKQIYGYNSAGEVATAKRLLTAQGNTYLRGQSFGWTYDGIGNRLTSARGGDESANNLRGTIYNTPDALNRYTSIQNPAAADVTGLAPAADGVTVNGSAASRQGEFFHHEVTGANSTGPDWKAVSVIDGSDTKTGSLLIPPASQTPDYDADGNLTSDGIYGYTWDGENRLVKIEALASAVLAGVPYQRVECVYDSQWRRVQRLRFDQPSSTTPVETTRYLWAGWRCLAELGATDALKKTLVWGLDSQQTIHLGDGNGALLWTNDAASGETHFCHYDGNCNVVGPSNASGEQTAEYQYSAFGELIGKRGRYADANLYRFSTKPFEEVGILYYYGYRYYDPVTGRWPSRDPIGVRGGLNLYGFVYNDPFTRYDDLGGMPGKYSPHFKGPKPTPVGYPTRSLRIIAGTVGSVATGDIYHKPRETPAYGDSQCKFLFTVSGINMRGGSQEKFHDQIRSLPAFQDIQTPAWVNNPSNFPIGSFGAGDLVQILLNETILAVTVADQEMAKQLKLAAAMAKKNGCCRWSINVVAHSQGTMVFRRAMGLLDADTKSHIHFTGLGGETIMGPNEGLGSAENFVEMQDLVPKLNPFNWPRFRHEFDDSTANGGRPSHSWEDVYIPYLQDNPSVFSGRGDF